MQPHALRAKASKVLASGFTQALSAPCTSGPSPDLDLRPQGLASISCPGCLQALQNAVVGSGSAQAFLALLAFHICRRASSTDLPPSKDDDLLSRMDPLLSMLSLLPMFESRLPLRIGLLMSIGLLGSMDAVPSVLSENDTKQSLRDWA